MFYLTTHSTHFDTFIRRRILPECVVHSRVVLSGGGGGGTGSVMKY